MTVLAQISDLHITAGELIYGRVDTAQFLARAVSKLREIRPAAVIVTGDLVEGGTVGEYDRLRGLLAPLDVPVHLLLGNHDDRAAFRNVFGGGEFIQFTFDVGPLRVIALDTNDPGEPGGRLCATRLDWLATQLATAGDRPVILALHHPPFVTGLPAMDACGLAEADAEALVAIVARHPRIERVICGHVHRPMTTRFAHTVAMTSPSVAHQFGLVLDGRPLAMTLEPPGFTLHQWTGRGLVSHLAYTGDHGS
ncbi:MAG: phosphodiesterase [Kofleriaceae bacterium]